MKSVLILLVLMLTLTGCAHKELKAPCANIATLSSNTVPCDERKPVNSTAIPSVFAN